MEKLERFNKFVRRNAISLLLLLFLILGVMGVLLFEHEGRYPSRFCEHVSMALAVASIIGLTIEFTLQKKIAINVFEATIGYLLPDELRSELRWIYNLPTMCIQHVQSVKLELIDGTDLVRYRSNIVRRFKNLTDKPVPFGVGVATDEWFQPGYRSRILRMTYQFDEEPESENFATSKLKTMADSIVTETVNVTLHPSQFITTVTEIEEIKRKNDGVFVVFGNPTANATVMVDAPPELVARVSFDHRSSEDVMKKGDWTWQLHGTLLPNQSIRVRWYSKEDSATWLEATGKAA